MSTTVALPPTVSFKPASGLKDNAPAIIVLQEWWGINNQIKLHAQNFANDIGAEAIIPDLYKGKIGINAEEAGHLMDSLDFKNAVDEIEVLCTHLRNDNPARKIGVTGFCMGGALSLATAALVEKPLDACSVFYGTPPVELCDVGVIPNRTPFQGHFGDLDPQEGLSCKKSADTLKEKLEASKGAKPFEVFQYEKEGHAFMNTDEFSEEQKKELQLPGAFDAKTRELAWTNTVIFFKTNLF